MYFYKYVFYQKCVSHAIIFFSENFKIKDDYPVLVIILLLGNPIQNKVFKNSSILCVACSKKFKNKDLLSVFQSCCHRLQLFYCSYCFEKFKWKKYIPIHVRKKATPKHYGTIKE